MGYPIEDLLKMIQDSYAELEIIAMEADKEIYLLKSILKKQIMIYQVDDQAWDKESSANKILDRLLRDGKP
jgi:hypothetical protein